MIDKTKHIIEFGSGDLGVHVQCSRCNQHGISGKVYMLGITQLECAIPIGNVSAERALYFSRRKEEPEHYPIKRLSYALIFLTKASLHDFMYKLYTVQNKAWPEGDSPEIVAPPLTFTPLADKIPAGSYFYGEGDCDVIPVAEPGRATLVTRDSRNPKSDVELFEIGRKRPFKYEPHDLVVTFTKAASVSVVMKVLGEMSEEAWNCFPEWYKLEDYK